jgi:tetratricopeptide (TPR) repeat protein
MLDIPSPPKTWRCRVRKNLLLVRMTACVLLLVSCTAAGSKPAKAKQPSDKVPITTSSDEARQLYLQARDLQEKLRATDAHAVFVKAVAADPNFALGYVGLANNSASFKEFMEATKHAASLAPGVSEGERHIILGLEAGLRNNPAEALSHYTALVKLYPNDERAQTLLGNTYFGRQDYEPAIEHFEKAIKINPNFSQPYNQLGYAYRFLGRYPEAETTFKKYIALIPDDPNPYDSYAELLMKMGRFDDSIKNYEKALSVQPTFINSYIGIANDHLYMGQPDKARASLAKMAEVARTTGERRAAHFWTASTYVYEGETDKAVAEMKASSELAKADNDPAGIAGDFTQIGDILREAHRYDDALASYKQSVAVMDKADVPAEVKSAAHRNLLFEEGRVAAITNDLSTAKARAAEYSKLVAEKNRPFEIRNQHELAGMIDQAEKHYAQAAEEFQKANQQDPRVLYMMSVALRSSGKTPEAADVAKQATNFNQLSFNSAYLREKPEKSGSVDAAN